MKKFLCLLLSSILVVSLAACASDEGKEIKKADNIEKTNKVAQVEQEQKKQKSIVEDKSKNEITKKITKDDVKKDNKSVELSNPIKTYTTLDEANTDIGFDFNEVNNLVEGKDINISGVIDVFIDISYIDGENTFTLRKAKGTGDMSGIYNEYSLVKTSEDNVTYKGENDLYSLVLWNTDEFAYSIFVKDSSGVELSVLENMVASIKG